MKAEFVMQPAVTEALDHEISGRRKSHDGASERRTGCFAATSSTEGEIAW